MSDREHAKEILEAARRDLRALHGMNDPQVFSDEIFGFHAQQAAERALKAWLAHNGIRFPKTHDLKQLIDLLVQSGIDPGDLSALVDLNAFAVQYRYESLFINEEALDRTELRPRIAALIDRVAEALQG
jgi:HEPN domain-containing protein